MLGKMGIYRCNLPVLFIGVVLTITVTSMMILFGQHVFLKDNNKGHVLCQQRSLLSREVEVHLLEKDILPKLVMELLRKLNSSSGALININVTNVIQAPGSQTGGSKMKSSKKDDKEELMEQFKPIMNDEEVKILFSGLIKLDEICKKYNFTYMMYSGTLLGSYRHHNVVPWDDDFDVFMNYTERETIISVLGKQMPDFDVVRAGSRVKFFSMKGSQTSKYPWRWPYIDISFFKENSTHIWDGSMEDDYGDRYYMYDKSIVFPLHRRPMGAYAFNSPRDSMAHLKRTYGEGILDHCYTSHYSHKFEELKEKTYKINCEELTKLYPFVYRAQAANGVRETLQQEERVIQSYVVKEPTYAITHPFKVQLLKDLSNFKPAGPVLYEY